MYIDDKPYYDGYLDYNEEKDLNDYLEEDFIIKRIYEVRDEIMSWDVKPDIISTRERYKEEINNLDDFIYYNDIIMDVYRYRYMYEEMDFEILKNYFICGDFLDDAKEYLKSLNYYNGSLKTARSLKDGSKGERLVRDILKKHNYTFKEQESDGCYNYNTFKALVFDFIVYVNDIKVYIEIQGKQHYEPVSFRGENEETKKRNFINQQIRDDIKKNFAESNGIYIALDYSEANLNKLEDRINNQLLTVLNKLRGDL